MGFKYYAGIFTISKKKIELFKNKIIKITHLTNKKSEKAIIKLLDNKILGFGHYYKSTHCKQDFEKLDAFIRQRLRRYISCNKDSKNKLGNLILTNATLKEMGLKSLIDIKRKYDQKKRHIFRNKAKKSAKTGQQHHLQTRPELEEIGFKYQQNLILNQLKQLTELVKKIEKKIRTIEKKLKG